MMLKIAIVDDNQLSIDDLENKLKQLLTKKYQLNTFINEADFIRKINNNSFFDIVFLDIKLKENSGIDIAHIINNVLPEASIVFITGYPSYHQDVYESRHTYFLIKPIEEKYLKKSLDKAMQNIYNNYIVLTFRKTSKKLLLNKIVYFESRLKNTAVIFNDGTEEIYPIKLKEIEEKLPVSFFRVHQSYIVNFNNIEKIERTKLTFSQSRIVPISRKFSHEVQNKIAKLLGEVSL